MTVNESLQHAQKIVRMLRSALDPVGFKGGHELLSVYVFLENHLVKANLEKSARTIQECADLIAPIRDAWTKAVQSEGE
jgi:flagellar protein FliS